MSVLEIKSALIDKINSTNDEQVLTHFYNLLELENLLEEEEVVSISKEEKEIYLSGVEQIKNGNVMSNETSKKLIQEWLNS
jgi:hypothetical protein